MRIHFCGAAARLAVCIMIRVALCLTDNEFYFAEGQALIMICSCVNMYLSSKFQDSLRKIEQDVAVLKVLVFQS